MLVAEGADTAMGFHLPATLEAAGFRFDRVRAEAVIEGQGKQFSPATLVNLMRPRLVSNGIADEVTIDALLQRIEAERASPTDVYVGAMSFCAWASKP
jgi:hypothetical protein